MIFDRHANLKYKFGNRHFWAEGFYVSTVGLNEATIKKYIQDQEKEDILKDKLSVKEYFDPFKGQLVSVNPFRDCIVTKGCSLNGVKASAIQAPPAKEAYSLIKNPTTIDSEIYICA